MVKEVDMKKDVIIMNMDMRKFSSYEGLYQKARRIGSSMDELTN